MTACRLILLTLLVFSLFHPSSPAAMKLSGIAVRCSDLLDHFGLRFLCDQKTSLKVDNNLIIRGNNRSVMMFKVTEYTMAQ